MSIADLRKDYSRMSLTETDLLDNPIEQFSIWFGQALSAEIPEANAMCLSTVAPDNRPSSRIVLIKNIDARGFTWFTNYDSRKGQDLINNPYAALLFHWIELERQVRIEGRVERVTEAESEEYFNSRPLLSRLAAIASVQSAPVADRAALEQQLLDVEHLYGDRPVRPAYWGGYRLVPDRLEFWQGRRSRLHDRILYTLNADSSWNKQRLQP
ncbi:MAG TPA: pyridoxamine 5'-phosphate oxidase [Herbaspirillum sp.]|jgi:pyridoxamine 5'-phosphate oxidase|nr:pyridoxamine 5'-phosphate oxidase [Herbaspirillum sp.]